MSMSEEILLPYDTYCMNDENTKSYTLDFMDEHAWRTLDFATSKRFPVQWYWNAVELAPGNNI